jgi:serine O-acetyltransferase
VAAGVAGRFRIDSVFLLEDFPTMSDGQAVDVECTAPADAGWVNGDDLPPLNPGTENLNPPGIGFFSLLREDLKTYDSDPLQPGFWAVAMHRYGNWRMGIRPKLLRLPFTLFYRSFGRFVELIAGIHLPYTVRLGRRVRIWHHGGIVLHARSIGDDVHIRQNTTFGIATRSRGRAIPTIEDRADIGCGACVLGNVTVGHDSLIGANAVVLSDIPPYATAVGIPARVVKISPP